MKRAIVSLLLLLGFAGVAQAADEGVFLAIGATGCKAWSLSPTDRRFLAWSGTCTGGLADGRGILQFESTDDKGAWHPVTYEGRLVKGKRSGFGKMRSAVFGDVDGQYREGLVDGWAAQRFPGGARFEGQWRRGVRHGLGTYVNETGLVTRSRFVDGKIAGDRQFETADGKSWGIMDERADGTGRAVFNSGGEAEAGSYRIVDGSWKREGRGVFLFEQRNIFYIGDFADNLPNGTGTYVQPDKGNAADAAVYGGQFRNGCLWRDQYYYVSIIVNGDSCKRR